jgi:hypothetical protein
MREQMAQAVRLTSPTTLLDLWRSAPTRQFGRERQLFGQAFRGRGLPYLTGQHRRLRKGDFIGDDAGLLTAGTLP